MPQVPYSPVPDVRPSGQGTPRVSVNAPASGLGGAVASAIEGFGKQTEQSGDQIFQRALAIQELRNETDAKNADSQYMIQSSKLRADFLSKQGEQVGPEALDAHIKALDKIRTDLRANLPNDAARRMYDASSLGFMGREVFSAATHAGQQQKVAANNASTARQDILLNDIQSDPGDDVSFQRKLSGALSENRPQAVIGGWSPDQIEDQNKKVTSKAWSFRISELAKTEPFKAQEMLDANKDKIHYADRSHVEDVVRSHVNDAGARTISHDTLNELYEPSNPTMPEKTEKQFIDEGKAAAQKIRPNDPVFLDRVESRISADFNKYKAQVANYNFLNMQTVGAAMEGANGGSPPTNPDELRAMGSKVEAAWNALRPEQRMALEKKMATNAKGDVFETRQTIARYLQLKGMADADPAKFMEVDVAAEHLPLRQVKALGQLQLQKKQKAESDPRVAQALQTLRPALLEPAGITKAKDENAYNQFVGALQDALEQHQQETKKVPNYKETLEIGQRLLQDRVDPENSHLFGFLSGTTRQFQTIVPNAAKEAIEADFTEKGITATPEMVQRIYSAKRYQELYGKKEESK